MIHREARRGDEPLDTTNLSPQNRKLKKSYWTSQNRSPQPNNIRVLIILQIYKIESEQEQCKVSDHHVPR